MLEKAIAIMQTLEARRPLLPLSPQAPVDPALDEAIGALAMRGGAGASAGIGAGAGSGASAEAGAGAGAKADAGAGAGAKADADAGAGSGASAGIAASAGASAGIGAGAGAGAGADEEAGKARDAALAVVSGLYLWNGNLDRSHTISQDIENATGSYWHGIMHRMEGDYWNAKYWFRRVGAHPAMKRLQAEASRRLAESQADALPRSVAAERLSAAVRNGAWDAAAFVDAVEAQERGRGGEETRALLQALQHLELSALTAYCIEAVRRED